MSESESENESDLDFSASEDEYVPSGADSDDDSVGESDDDDDLNGTVVDAPRRSKKKTKSVARKKTEDDDDSDSSVENYLVNPNELDLASDFFNPNKAFATDAPKFDCNVGLQLSDSEEEEVLDAAPSTSQAADVKVMDFKRNVNYTEGLKDLATMVEQLKAKHNYTTTDTLELLSIGEPSLMGKKSSQSKRKGVLNSSDESDFEEVEEKIIPEKRSDVEVVIGAGVKQKPNKYQAEIEASIKRKINRQKKESQLMMHKVHLLSWIGYGNYVNKVLNSTKLMEMVVKFIPSDKCYPKDQTDQDYFQQITKWYKTTMGLKTKEQNCPLKCLPPLATSLALQIKSKMAICKKDFVFLFIILLRSIGIQCRLVINLATVSIRPAAKDLCVISTKTTEKSSSSDKSKTTKKTTKTEKASSQDKNAAKKSTASRSKAKPRANSISGTKSEIVNKSSEDPNQPKTLESQSGDGNKKNLKRSVSVQNSSANNKRSRLQSSSPSKANNGPQVKASMQNGTNTRSSSVEKPTTSKASKLSLSKQKPVQSSEPKEVVDGEVSVSSRTRKRVTRNSSAVSSQTIPQLDGGDDKKRKKPAKGDLFKIRLSLRQKSMSPSSTRSIPLVTPTRTRAKSNAPRLRLPSMSRATSKSPTSSASERVSRKSQFEKTKSNESSPPSSASTSPKLEMSLMEPTSPKMVKSPSKSPNPTKRTKRPLYTSPTKPWRHDDQPKNKSNLNETLSSETDLQEEAESQQDQSIQSSKETLSPLKEASNRSTKLASTTSKDATISPSKEPTSTSGDSTVSPTKPAASSKRSSSTTNSSNSDKKVRSKSKESASTSTAATVSPTKSAKSSTRSNSATKSSNTVRKLRSKSKEPVSTSTAATVSPTKSAESSRRSNSATKPSNPDTKLRSKSKGPASTSPTKSVPPTSNSSKPPSTSKSKQSSKSSTEEKPAKSASKRKPTISVSSDSDFAPTPRKKPSPTVEKPLPKQVERLKKPLDRRILSSDDDSTVEPTVKKDDMNYWIEVYCEAESKWICIDLFKMKVNCVEDIKKKATKPIAYVFAWNNNNKIKDVSPRYCSQWNTATRKLRVQSDWLDEALTRYKEPLSQRCVVEDRELEEIHAQTPIPTSIIELKNHPLYALTRHLLKFEGIYPPNPAPLGYIRNEPIYSRLCVHTLHSRELWVKQARVVKPGEIPYKIVKARPKWDRSANKMLESLPLELFGKWQTGPYEPPTAENGIVPRNAYGNVELFKPEMLPKKTVHLRFAGLNRTCAKLKIDCAQAVVGFDFHGGFSHPTFDGFVVCEEFAELVTEKWCEEEEESYRKAKDKQNQRVYDNWKKLIKGLLIRERLQRKYNFAGKEKPTGK